VSQVFSRFLELPWAGGVECLLRNGGFIAQGQRQSLLEHRSWRIPIHNPWLLMLYASELTRYAGQFNALIEADSDD
jgi:hypothetical protein